MAAPSKTYEKIIQAALELIARQGYHNTSIKNITDKLGMTPSAIYAHFESKAEICHEIIKLWDTHYVDRAIQTAREESGSATNKLHRLISIGASQIGGMDLINAYYILRDELKSDPEFVVQFTNIHLKYQNFLVDLFRMGIKEGSLKKNLDPVVMASLYRAIIRGMFQEWVFFKNQIDGEQFIRNFRTVFFKGIEA